MYCSYGCGTNSSDPTVNTCSGCKANGDDYPMICQAFVVNECFGDNGAYQLNECANYTLSIDFHYGTDCENTTASFSGGEYGGLAAADYCTFQQGLYIYSEVSCETMDTTMPPQTTVETTEEVDESGVDMYGVVVAIALVGFVGSWM